MAYEQKPNSGSLFRNEKPREGKQDAEYTGKAVIDGVEYWMSAWVNEMKGDKHRKPDGTQKKYFNIQFKPVQQGGSSSRQQPQRQQPEDDIPF